MARFLKRVLPSCVLWGWYMSRGPQVDNVGVVDGEGGEQNPEAGHSTALLPIRRALPPSTHPRGRAAHVCIRTPQPRIQPLQPPRSGSRSDEAL